MRGQEVPPVCAVKYASKGSSDNEPNVWQVKPTGPSGVIAVITTTPVAKLLATSLNSEMLRLTRVTLLTILHEVASYVHVSQLVHLALDRLVPSAASWAQLHLRVSEVWQYSPVRFAAELVLDHGLDDLSP